MKPQHDPYASCPCGSGKKYKFCCLGRDREAAREAARAALARGWSISGPAGAAGPVSLDLAAGERLNDQGVRLLEYGDYSGAERYFRESIEAAGLIPAGHNNLAGALFLQGKLHEAIGVQESALQDLPHANPFGRAQLVHFYLVAGREPEAEAALAWVLQSPPNDSFELARVCRSLTLLGRHRQIVDLLRGRAGALNDMLHWYAGVAAANLGSAADALVHLRAISARAGVRVRAMENIRRLESGAGPGTVEGNWPYLECVEIISGALFTLASRQVNAPKHPLYPVLHTRLMVDLVVTLLERDQEGSVQEIVALGGIRHPRAVEVLEKIAQGTYGTDALRLAAMQKLVERGVWSKDEAHRMWLEDRWTEVKSVGYMIDPSAPASARPLDDALMPRFTQALEAGRRGQLKQAEALWRELLAAAPEFTPFHLNLGTLLLDQKRLPEAESCLRRALELEPDYLFAPCNLAVLLSGSGRAAEARQLLDCIVVPVRVHPDVLACYLAAEVQVAMAEDEYDKALGWLQMAESVVPDHPSIRALAEKLGPLCLFKDAMAANKGYREARRAKQRQRVLAPAATLETCFDTYTKNALAGMAKALQLGVRASQMRKAELLAAVCAGLRRTEVCRAALLDLGEKERAALRDLAAAGGRQDYATFTRAHGTDYEDLDDWAFRQPESPVGRLKCRGLLVEATLDSVESVLIPAGLPLDLYGAGSPKNLAGVAHPAAALIAPCVKEGPSHV